MLADLNADGRMDRREFAVAMYLIRKKLQGFELPASLPSNLLQMDTAGAPTMMGGYAAPPGPASGGGGFMLGIGGGGELTFPNTFSKSDFWISRIE